MLQDYVAGPFRQQPTPTLGLVAAIRHVLLVMPLVLILNYMLWVAALVCTVTAAVLVAGYRYALVYFWPAADWSSGTVLATASALCYEFAAGCPVYARAIQLLS